MPDDAATLIDAVEELRELRVRLLNEGRIDEMVDQFYASDARLLPPDQPVIEGREGVRAFWQAAPEQGLILLETKSTFVDGSGDVAYETGAFRRTLRPKHGHPFTDIGKYLVVFRRNGDGRFQAQVEMFNTPRGR